MRANAAADDALTVALSRMSRSTCTASMGAEAHCNGTAPDDTERPRMDTDAEAQVMHACRSHSPAVGVATHSSETTEKSASLCRVRFALSDGSGTIGGPKIGANALENAPPALGARGGMYWPVSRATEAVPAAIRASFCAKLSRRA